VRRRAAHHPGRPMNPACSGAARQAHTDSLFKTAIMPRPELPSLIEAEELPAMMVPVEVTIGDSRA
jgi:hypothetical protein